MASQGTAKKRQNRLADRIPWLVLFICLFLTALGVWVAIQSETERERLRFEIAMDAVQKALLDQTESYIGVVWAEVGLFQANDLQVNSSDFRKFRIAADWGGRVDGLASLAFIQRVKWENRAAFLEKMRQHYPGFKISPEPTAGEPIHVVTLLESHESVANDLLETNPMGDPKMRSAMERAARTGAASVTDASFQSTDGRESNVVSFFAPVYYPGAELLPRNKREPLVYGFAKASFHLNNLVERMSREVDGTIGFRITSETESGQESLILDTGNFGQGQLRSRRKLEIAGRVWNVAFWTLPAFEQLVPPSYDVQLVAASGTLLAFALFGLTMFSARERKAREQRNRDLEEMDKAKTIFFSNLSHELRTPLNGIIGMSDLLYDTELDEVQQGYLNSIASCGKSLLDLIGDVLDLSKIRAGKMELNPAPHTLKEIFEQAILVVLGPAKGKGVELKLEWDDALPTLVEIDAMRLRQVLVNLLGNAIKFTDEGAVTLRTRYLSGSSELVFEVEDTGIGISESNVSLLFKPFSQVASGKAHSEASGTGLGLHLCREILELMGGGISVESTVGRGSTFRGRIPLKETELNPYETQQMPLQERNLSFTLDILVVDDNPINRKVLQLQLEKMGQKVVVAESGAQALTEVENQDFDLILMDCHMPGIDGLEASRQIRASKGEEPRIVALTAYTEDSRRKACMEAGMNAFLTKPIDSTKLWNVVQASAAGEL